MKINKEKYTSHIKDNDKLIDMRRVLDKIEIVINNHSLETTDFLDPYERLLAKSILNRFDEISYEENGGVNKAERKTINIYPSYYTDIEIPKNLRIIRISGNIEDLSHRDFLGAILNLGIKRAKIGDILVCKSHADVIVKNDVADFIFFNLERISNKKVSVSEIGFDLVADEEILYKEIEKTLSSLRLDVYISSSYNLSRQESLDIIKSGKVKVNWMPMDKPFKELVEGDVIAIRGYGRSNLYAVHGLSKKGKIKATIRILI